MKFRHRIPVNDPRDPFIGSLNRAQLWRGLVMRAEAPQLFMPHLDECQLSDQTAESVRRMLRYGHLRIHDLVTYEPPVRVRYQVPAQGAIPASGMSMSIEEPEPAALFLCFDYDDGAPEAIGSEQVLHERFLRSAYEAADIDTVRLIRELAVNDRLR